MKAMDNSRLVYRSAISWLIVPLGALASYLLLPPRGDDDFKLVFVAVIGIIILILFSKTIILEDDGIFINRYFGLRQYFISCEDVISISKNLDVYMVPFIRVLCKGGYVLIVYCGEIRNYESFCTELSSRFGHVDPDSGSGQS